MPRPLGPEWSGLVRDESLAGLTPRIVRALTVQWSFLRWIHVRREDVDAVAAIVRALASGTGARCFRLAAIDLSCATEAELATFDRLVHAKREIIGESAAWTWRDFGDAEALAEGTSAAWPRRVGVVVLGWSGDAPLACAPFSVEGVDFAVVGGEDKEEFLVIVRDGFGGAWSGVEAALAAASRRKPDHAGPFWVGS